MIEEDIDPIFQFFVLHGDAACVLAAFLLIVQVGKKASPLSVAIFYAIPVFIGLFGSGVFYDNKHYTEAFYFGISGFFAIIARTVCDKKSGVTKFLLKAVPVLSFAISAATIYIQKPKFNFEDLPF